MGTRLILATWLLLTLPAVFAEQGFAFSDLPSCKDYWANLIPQNLHKYNYQSDAKFGRDGNTGYSKYAKRVAREKCRKDWVVLVYMAADNDLQPYALWDTYEMEAGFAGSANVAGSTVNVDVVVQFDGRGKKGLRRLHMFATPEVYSSKDKSDFEKLSENSIRSPIVEIADENRPEKDKLEDFLLWAQRRYPAKNTAVVVWGHGQGWKSFSRTSRGEGWGGIGFNQSSGGRLDIPSIRSALAKFKQVQGRPIDVYASDACLMQMIEVGTELANEARFIVGSTQVQNFLGLPYRRLLYELNTGRFNGERSKVKRSSDAQDEPYLLAKMIPNLMKQSLHPELGLQGRSDPEGQRTITSSAITSAELQSRLLPTLSLLGVALEKFILAEAMHSLDLQLLLRKVPELEGGAQDLGIFLGMLSEWVAKEKNTSGVSKELAELEQRVNQSKESLDLAVLSFAYGSAYGIDERSGRIGYIPRAISLWLPQSREEYLDRKAEFEKSSFYRKVRWGQWLKALWN